MKLIDRIAPLAQSTAYQRLDHLWPRFQKGWKSDGVDDEELEDVVQAFNELTREVQGAMQDHAREILAHETLTEETEQRRVFEIRFSTKRAVEKKLSAYHQAAEFFLTLHLQDTETPLKVVNS